MANALLDENGRPTLIAISKDDGATIVRATANPTTHALVASDGDTGNDLGNNNGNAMLDENSKPVLLALSSNNDGTLVEVYSDPLTGAILIQST